MPKRFNITGVCIPELHYMVNIEKRIDRIVRDYITNGSYFTINRARQFGKTTTLYLLEKRLKEQYTVIRLSFEAADELFRSMDIFARGLIRNIRRELKLQGAAPALIDAWSQPVSSEFPFLDLSERIKDLCKSNAKKIILMIDEVDKSSDNQIFLSFLGLLRNKYLDQQQQRDATFHSVILAGVYDVKNLKLKLHPGEESKYNSPWNVAADFTMDLSFRPDDIAGMLAAYENDCHTGMDIPAFAQWLYDYTDGYPYMVSRLCMLIDEQVAGSDDFPLQKDAWTKEGFLKAVRIFLQDSNTLFDDVVKTLEQYPLLKDRMKDILFRGTRYSFENSSPIINMGVMFGFLKNMDGSVAIANRIFETKLYNLFLSEDELASASLPESWDGKNQFIVHGMLQMKLVMEKFFEYFVEICGNADEKFIENEGRRIFLMYLRPIINGAGNYYIEAQTRDRTRTDVIVDYRGQRFIVELKLWRGNAYHKRGERQLLSYLDYYNEDTGYLLSFNFNKKKQTGMHEILLDGKKILEVVV